MTASPTEYLLGSAGSHLTACPHRTGQTSQNSRIFAREVAALSFLQVFYEFHGGKR